MTRLFLSYARADDEGLGADSFVRRLYNDLTACDFEVWWDREKMAGRGETHLRSRREWINGRDETKNLKYRSE